jgi:hypothetical protein
MDRPYLYTKGGLKVHNCSVFRSEYQVITILVHRDYYFLGLTTMNSTVINIQQAAINLFKKNGFENTTIDEICRRSQITKSTFYYHFKSKEQLLHNLYENLTPLSPKTYSQIMTSKNSWEKIWTLMQPAIDWTERVGFHIYSQIIISDLQNKVDTLELPENSDLQKIYIEIIKVGQENGHFANKEPPGFLFDNIKCIVYGISINWCILRGKFPLKEKIKRNTIALLGVDKRLLRSR